MTEIPPPKPYYNRPGLPALAYRLGDFNSIRKRLLRRLVQSFPSPSHPQGVTLRQLTTRDRNDPAIALLDSVAVLADVLTFYQERIANEGFLNTATELRSVLELARMVGYELNPGVAASTLLAFTVDDAPGSPTRVNIPKGTAVLSIPEKEELPQTFETSTDFIARLEWNALKPRPTRPQLIHPKHRELLLQGVNTRLQVGDTLLLLDGDGQEIEKRTLLTVESLEIVVPADHTRITWKPLTPLINLPQKPTLLAFRQQARVFGFNAPRWQDVPDTLKQEAAAENRQITQGGVLFTGDDGASLQSMNAGLPSADVRCVAIAPSGYYFAGFNNGVFRSKDAGTSWQAVNAGLTNLNIQTVYVAPTSGHLFVGTADGGVFRSKDDGESWTPLHLGTVRVENQGTSNVRTVNTGIPNTVVRSLLQVSFSTAPPLTSLGTGNLLADGRIEISGTGFPPDILVIGSFLTAGGQTTTVTTITNVEFTSEVRLTVAPAFGPEGFTFDTGNRLTATAAASSNQITIRANTVLPRFAVNQSVRIAGVSRTIIGIAASQYTARITVNPPITLTSTQPLTVSSTLPFDFAINTPLLFAGTDDGLFFTADQGQNWSRRGFTNQVVRGLLRNLTGNRLFAATDQGVFRSDDGGQAWFAVSNELLPEDKRVNALAIVSNKLFAATQRGIYVCDLSAPTLTWAAHTTDPALTGVIRSIVTMNRTDTPQYIFAATNEGIFRYEDTTQQNIQKIIPWGGLSFGLSNDHTKMLVGTQFVSFKAVPATAVGIHPGSPPPILEDEEWFNFKIDPVNLELDNKYSKILPESWIVLMDGVHHQVRQVNTIENVQVNDFGLTGEVSRLQLREAIVPENYRRRETVLLVQSESLELAPDPLAIAPQQANIFFDPITRNQVFLSEYVPELLPKQQVIVSGQRIRAVVQHVGGVMRLQNDPNDAQNPNRWHRFPSPITSSGGTRDITAGLTHTGVTCLAVYRSQLIAGTAGGGVFRLKQQANLEVWEPINDGLPNRSIQSLAVQAGHLFAATPDGIFRSEDGQTWQDASRNLVARDVRSLLPLPTELLAATCNGGIVRSRDGGNLWSQAGLETLDVQTLARVRSPVLTQTLFAGTVDRGVFRSTDGGVSWQPLNRGLTNPNVTALVAYHRPGTGTVIATNTTVLGENTRFTEELAVGDDLIIAGVTRQVTAIVSDTVLQINHAISPEPVRSVPEDVDVQDDGSDALNAAILPPAPNPLELAQSPTPFQILRVLAGTAGSGIFVLLPDRDAENTRSLWKPASVQPLDLTIRCLVLEPRTLQVYAGTETAGIFRSLDQGDRWAAFNQGLTSLDSQLNPLGLVNTDFRAIIPFVGSLVAAGIGILISEDALLTAPIRAGDRLFVMAPPQPLLPRHPDPQLALEQRWRLQDRDGFVGVVLTPTPQDVVLEAAIAEDPSISEPATILLPPIDQQVPILTLEAPLQNSYDPATVSIFANIVPATHGETVPDEVLGSGDSSQPNQAFVLRKKPLTYVAATTPKGTISTLEVRVNEVQWQEVDSLFGHGPDEQVYITRRAQDGTVTVIFGDGVSGMRLPTGLENVRATYRSGMGLAGLMGGDRLSLLRVRPLGISEVNNPRPTSGAADPESITEARTSAPLTVRTLGRIVSLQDYEDFTRAFSGIGKARATVVSAGGVQTVHITVAASTGGVVPADSVLYTNLVQAIAQAHDPIQQVQVDSYERLLFNLEARLLIDPRYRPEPVLAQVQAVLTTRFAFEQRHFGQAVTSAEAIALMQAVAGVVAVDLDALYRRDRARSLEAVLPAQTARWDVDKRQILPAQLLLINPAGIGLRAEVSL